MQSHLTPATDVALFIDWENFKISLAVGHRTPNVSALKEEVSNLGRVVVAKAYADWVTRTPEIRGASQFINDPPALYAAGIEPVRVGLPFLPQKDLGVTGVVPEGHPHELHGLPLKLLVHLGQDRGLHAAGRAPRGPEIHHYHFASEVGEFQDTAADQLEVKVPGWAGVYLAFGEIGVYG